MRQNLGMTNVNCKRTFLLCAFCLFAFRLSRKRLVNLRFFLSEAFPITEHIMDRMQADRSNVRILQQSHYELQYHIVLVKMRLTLSSVKRTGRWQHTRVCSTSSLDSLTVAKINLGTTLTTKGLKQDTMWCSFP